MRRFHSHVIFDDAEPGYLRAVTRRASTIFPPERLSCKQGAEKSGHICLEQFETAVRPSSRSPFAIAATSGDCTFWVKPGRAITNAPSSENVAIAESNLTILNADCLIFGPATFGDRHNNNHRRLLFQLSNFYLCSHYRLTGQAGRRPSQGPSKRESDGMSAHA